MLFGCSTICIVFVAARILCEGLAVAQILCPDVIGRFHRIFREIVCGRNDRTPLLEVFRLVVIILFLYQLCAYHL